MSVLQYSPNIRPGGVGYFEARCIFVQFGGPEAGTVFIKDSLRDKMTRAEPDQIAAAEARIPGFKKALAAARAIRDDDLPEPA